MAPRKQRQRANHGERDIEGNNKTGKHGGHGERVKWFDWGEEQEADREREWQDTRHDYEESTHSRGKTAAFVDGLQGLLMLRATHQEQAAGTQPPPAPTNIGGSKTAHKQDRNNKQL